MRKFIFMDELKIWFVNGKFMNGKGVEDDGKRLMGLLPNFKVRFILDLFVNME